MMVAVVAEWFWSLPQWGTVPDGPQKFDKQGGKGRHPGRHDPGIFKWKYHKLSAYVGLGMRKFTNWTNLFQSAVIQDASQNAKQSIIALLEFDLLCLIGSQPIPAPVGVPPPRLSWGQQWSPWHSSSDLLTHRTSCHENRWIKGAS